MLRRKQREKKKVFSFKQITDLKYRVLTRPVLKCREANNGNTCPG